ncbi:Rap1a/Tai family immunity protein [Burkholderia sp. PAMC 26561]|uniref:Rap1a/Tai family immunity protein n=1 Tax=Burkholderia sp. PAMC 26561 TaxID=1795043 RepID=UPI00076AF69D|nr:Rap1a/Tai family immunity protein [Burkholderia sp. PAMC 26561]AME28663.1 hypothetical protein AXG89_33275 [Burkholderia sp. PAMC 26561]
MKDQNKGRRALLAVFAVFVTWTLASHAASPAGAYVEGGYLSGQHYRNSPFSERLGYVQGLVDGILYSAMFGAREEYMRRLKVCIAQVSGGQLVAIVDKYVSEHPSQWDWQMNLLAHNALILACRERASPIS